MNKYLYVIGIDGGGTKTNAVLCALDGKILSEAQGSPSNLQIAGVESTANIILDLIETCCHSVGCSISEIGSIVAGIAGAGREEDKQKLYLAVLQIAEKRNIAMNKLRIESDARIALEGAFNGNPGIVVIAGTGSIVVAKDKKGRFYRAGGWGRIIGDEGSGYSIGREALQAVAKMIDGYGEKTKLRKIFQDKFNMINQESIIKAIYRDGFPIASLAQSVIEAAGKGDKIAKQIIKKSSTELIKVITCVAKRIKHERVKIALVGSLVENENAYSKILCKLIKQNIPNVLIQKSESSPVVGAAIMATKEIKPD